MEVLGFKFENNHKKQAIILETAVINKMELVTAEVNGFANIEPELKISNPIV